MLSIRFSTLSVKKNEKNVMLIKGRHGMAWHGMAWHGMAWHGMAWQGIAAWHGMAWQGIAEH